jgi:hypothetical protein
MYAWMDGWMDEGMEEGIDGVLVVRRLFVGDLLGIWWRQKGV